MLALPVQVRFVSACHALYLRCASPRLREVECVPMTQYWHPYFFAFGLVAFLPVGVEVIRAEMFAFEFDQALFEFE